MIICSSSNIDLIQGVSGYGTAADGATDWRIENTATGVFNILNSPNLLTPNVSIIDAGNIGIGTIPVSGTNKLQVQGDTSVTGLITATKTTAGTNDILAMRYDSNNGIRFQQTLVAANDVRYDIIQKTNNADYTTPAISIYKGNVGIGTTNPNAELQISCTSTATNPDTGGTIIGLYVHNPTNTASQNSVILNRIAGTTAAKVIYAFNVAGSYGCSLSINGSDTTDRLLRFNSNSDATGTDLMVINNSNGNVSIGNVVTATYKLNITGSVNVSGGYFVAGVAFKPATAVLADTATALATSRTIAGVGFTGATNIDIPYFNLTNKITAGNGISLTTGSASSSPSISTNLTAGNGISISAAASPVITANISAGTNITFTGTNPISISAAGGTASQWTGNVGANIYYNSGNVGIGTATPSTILDIYKSSYTGALLSLDAGAEGDTSGTLNPRGIGKPLIKLGKKAWSNFGGGTGDYYGIGFGYSPLLTDFQCVEIGTLITSTSGQETGDLVFSTRPNTTNVAATERMRITSTGTIVVPEYSSFYQNANLRWLLWTGNQNYFVGGDNNGSGLAHIWRNSANTDGFYMYSNGNYSARGSYQAWSDIRIKKDIEDINDESALQMILAIEPKTYKYIDGNKSKERVYGFIAQQIKDVIPEAVVLIETVIPNIYKNCICEDKRIYIDVPIETLGRYIEIYGYGKYKITKIELDYIEVVNDMHSKDIPDGEQFVYGYEVKDFHTINKEYIFTLNVCATQELHRRIEAQSVVIKSYEDRIKDLETKVERLINSMNA